MPPAINPLQPIANVASIDRLMAIAIGMEHEAARRYRELAEHMRRIGDVELADLFAELAELEARHEDELARWAEREGRGRPAPEAFAWALPETFGDEAAESLTPYRALSIAVRNEEKAFSFYTYLAAAARDATVRERAEALAREELAHVAQLRALRRRAYHADRPAPREKVATLEQFRDLVAGLESGAAQIDDLAAAALAAEHHPAAAGMLRRIADDDRHRAAGDGGPSSTIVERAREAGVLVPGALTAVGALRLALRNAEEVLDRYMAVAEQADDQRLMVVAQEQAELAVARLAVIRSQLVQVED